MKNENANMSTSTLRWRKNCSQYRKIMSSSQDVKDKSFNKKCSLNFKGNITEGITAIMRQVIDHIYWGKLNISNRIGSLM